MKNFSKLAITAAMLVSGSAFAATTTISGTGHDLSQSGSGGASTGDNGQMCVYCHTPHGGATSTPLWNRNAYAKNDYTLYTSPTIDMTIGQPGADSLICLGCHDGITAMDSIVNEPNKGWSTATTRTMSSTVSGYIGVDLKSEHPVGVTYDTTTDGDQAFKALNTATANGVTFYSTKVECASCHQVHTYDNMPFLRTTNDNSNLCFACHNK